MKRNGGDIARVEGHRPLLAIQYYLNRCCDLEETETERMTNSIF
jgi:hypothetical protein